MERKSHCCQWVLLLNKQAEQVYLKVSPILINSADPQESAIHVDPKIIQNGPTGGRGIGGEREGRSKWHITALWFFSNIMQLSGTTPSGVWIW